MIILKNKETKIGLVVITLIVILTIAYFSYKDAPVDIPVDIPEEIDTNYTIAPEVLATEYEVFEGVAILPEPEIIPLIEVCFKIPADTEEAVDNMVMIAIERWLRGQKKTDIDTIESQVESNLEEIKKANLPK